MKNTLLALLAFGALVAAAFYVFKSEPEATTSAPAKTASASSSGVVLPTATSPIKPPAPAPVPVPVVKKVINTPAAQVPTSTADKPETSPRAELSTMIPELARLIDAQDYETLMQDFMPPEELDALLANAGQPGQPMALPELANRMRQNPRIAQQMAAASQFLAFLQTQTPTYDETGEKASYPISRIVNGQNTINFVKENGNWYVKNGSQFFR